MDIPPARRRFLETVQADEDRLNLAEAALWIASEEYAELDPQQYLSSLDSWSAGVQAAAANVDDPAARIALLNHALFDEAGFDGNADDYYDPRNSFLNDVIDRRRGIPITLSVIYLEVGWRLGWPLVGVGMPGHFLVRYEATPKPILIDPFAKGKLLSEADCEDRLRQIYGEPVRLRSDFLAPVSKRQILTRMLTNLKQVYFERKDHDRALAVVERLLLLAPENRLHIRDRGLIHGQRGDYSSASGDLQTYLSAEPEPADAAAIRRVLNEVWRRQAWLN